MVARLFTAAPDPFKASAMSLAEAPSAMSKVLGVSVPTATVIVWATTPLSMEAPWDPIFVFVAPSIVPTLEIKFWVNAPMVSGRMLATEIWTSSWFDWPI